MHDEPNVNKENVGIDSRVAQALEAFRQMPIYQDALTAFTRAFLLSEWSDNMADEFYHLAMFDVDKPSFEVDLDKWDELQLILWLAMIRDAHSTRSNSLFSKV